MACSHPAVFYRIHDLTVKEYLKCLTVQFCGRRERASGSGHRSGPGGPIVRRRLHPAPRREARRTNRSVFINTLIIRFFAERNHAQVELGHNSFRAITIFSGSLLPLQANRCSSSDIVAGVGGAVKDIFRKVW